MMSTEGELDAQLVERTVNGECEYCITNILIKICIHLNNVPSCIPVLFTTLIKLYICLCILLIYNALGRSF